jgi:tetratricopeptide (TPR) repeat protein
VYLLGRLEDGPVGDTLYLEAARANPPSVQACTSLSFRYLARGDFAKAVEWGAKARDLSPRDPVARKRYVDALLAAGKYAEVLQATAGTSPADTVLFLRDRLTAHVGSGEPGAAEGEVNRLIGPPIHRPGAPPTMDTEMRLLLAEVRRDRAKYLELVRRSDSPDRVAQNVLTGNYKSATQSAPNPKAIRPAGDWEDDATRAGLLYLAGLKAKDQTFADQQWKRLVDTLGRGDREARACAAVADGKKPFDADRIKGSLLQPSVKRVVLAAFARRFPAGAKELNAMSKQLDFDRDEYSLCLRYVTE